MNVAADQLSALPRAAARDVVRRLLLPTAVAGVAYAVAAHLSKLLAIAPLDAAPIQPAAGLAVAALLLLGRGALPGIWLGALVIHLSSSNSLAQIAVAAISASAIALQSFICAELTQRALLRPRLGLSGMRMFVSIVMRGPVVCLLGASFAIASQFAFGVLPVNRLADRWLQWWVADTLGVLLFTSFFVWLWPFQRGPMRRRASRIAWPVLLIGVLLVSGRYGIEILEQRQAREAKDNALNTAVEGGLALLRDAIESLSAVERYLSAASRVSARDFADFTSRIADRRELIAIEWVPRVGRDERQLFEAELSRDAGQARGILVLDAEGRPRPVHTAAQYYPVRFSEPLASNLASLGLDYGAVAAQTLNEARDRGEPVTESTVLRLREGRIANRVIVPVYRQGFDAKQEGMQQRREALRGFVIGLFDTEKLFAPLIDVARRVGIDFRVADITQADRPKRLIGDPAMTAQHRRTVNLVNLRFSVEFRSSGDLSRQELSPGVRAYLLLSLLVAVLASVSVIGASARAGQLEHDLAVRSALNEALKASEKDLATTLQSIDDAVLALDDKGCVTRINAAAERLLCRTGADALGRRCSDLFFIADEKEPSKAAYDLCDMVRRGDGCRLGDGSMLVTNGGGRHPVTGSVAPIRDGDAPVRGGVIVLREVLQERRARHALQASEARYRQLVERSPYAVFVESDGWFVFVNAKAVELFGASRAGQLLGQRIEERVHVSSMATLDALMVQARAGESCESPVELRWRRLDGTYFYGEPTAVSCDHQDRPAAMMLLRDTTQLHDEAARREAVVKQLRQSEERFRALTALSADWFWEQDSEHRFIALTDGSHDHGGLAASAHVGLRRWELPGTEPVSGDWEAHRAQLDAREEFHDLLIRRRTAGSDRYIRVSGAPRFDAEGRFAGYRGVASDVTQQYVAQQEVMAAKEAAEAASRAKSAFLATMSHELRTPMNGVIGMVDVLSPESMSDDQRDAVRIIRESSLSMLRLIDDILDFSKIEAGRLEIERAPVDLVDVVEGVSRSLFAMALERSVDLRIHVDADVPQYVWSDSTRLRQVLMNLTGNAIKFSGGREGVRGKVSIRASVAATTPLRVVLCVADNGIGMTPEAVDGLFRPFMQAETSTTRRFGGTGLGLAICKRLVDAMAGTIEVCSVVGQGTEFSVTLPFDVVAEQQRADIRRLDDLTCVVVGSAELPTNAISRWLDAAGARVRVVDRIETAASEACAGSVLIRRAGGFGGTIESYKELIAEAVGVRHLLITDGPRLRARAEAADLVTLDLDALNAPALVRAVALAAGRGQAQTFGNGEDRAQRLPQEKVSVEQARAQGRLILVAEDNRINQKVILRQLERLGYAAEVADDGAEALERWRRGGHALLLSDLAMPRMDGYALARAIRSEERPPRRLPILALTANAVKGEETHALAAGFDEYLTKPVRIERLCQVIERWLARAPPRVLQDEACLGSAVKADTAELTPAFDVTVLEALVGNQDNLVGSLLADFLVSTRAQGAAIRAAADAGDAARVSSGAHKLKSSARAVGATALGEICARLETAGLGGAQAEFEHLMANFDAAWRQVETRIESEVALRGLRAAREETF